MALTEQELQNWEKRLVDEWREVLERDRANRIEKQAIEEAKKKLADRPDVDRVDYLFNAINSDNRKLIVEVQHPVEIRQKHETPFDVATFFAAAFAAIVGLVNLIVFLT